ncbi:hypothetical protein BDV37DRAFT_172030 [Aspergillus pseudonomiae]|uniref:Uncharacterized protein n=1 Tax=Aspergillus pseudonomiae TaxID=1506151 RepID=A0A5N7DPL8_9EURO|nr:uncharacterized protein BDV37DRAFT_172030 [Aspergillus pseudonomiae]KAE8408410.1 hypothetical protein BDV37DRAFT_172030 [Aspergillus pseudonomiae]
MLDPWDHLDYGTGEIKVPVVSSFPASIPRDTSSGTPSTGAEGRQGPETSMNQICRHRMWETSQPMPPCPGLREYAGKTKHDYHQNM